MRKYLTSKAFISRLSVAIWLFCGGNILSVPCSREDSVRGSLRVSFFLELFETESESLSKSLLFSSSFTDFVCCKRCEIRNFDAVIPFFVLKGH